MQGQGKQNPSSTLIYMFQAFNVLLLKFALEAVTCCKFCLKYQLYKTQVLTQQKQQLNASPMQKPFRGSNHGLFYKTEE